MVEVWRCGWRWRCCSLVEVGGWGAEGGAAEGRGEGVPGEGAQGAMGKGVRGLGVVEREEGAKPRQAKGPMSAP